MRRRRISFPLFYIGTCWGRRQRTQVATISRVTVKAVNTVVIMPMPSVTALMVNNNEIPDIVAFLDDVARVFPALTFLACMRNPCSPPLACVSEDDVQAARRHRLYVAFRLPRLQFLDSSPVTAAERKEAAERGAYLAPRRPKAAPVSSSSLAAAERGSPGGGGAGGGAAAASPEAAPRKQPASFLGVGASSYDGRNSEGNRFITDKSL